MRCVNVKNLKSGDVLGRSSYDSNGRTLLVENTVITNNFIKRLIGHRVVSVYIDDPNCPLGGEDIISPQTRQMAINTMREIAAQVGVS